VSGLPAGLRATLRESVEAGDRAAFDAHLHVVRATASAAAEALAALAARYDYARLVTWLRDAEEA
jgi:hypothetical protein